MTKKHPYYVTFRRSNFLGVACNFTDIKCVLAEDHRAARVAACEGVFVQADIVSARKQALTKGAFCRRFGKQAAEEYFKCKT